MSSLESDNEEQLNEESTTDSVATLAADSVANDTLSTVIDQPIGEASVSSNMSNDDYVSAEKQAELRAAVRQCLKNTKQNSRDSEYPPKRSVAKKPHRSIFENYQVWWLRFQNEWSSGYLKYIGIFSAIAGISLVACLKYRNPKTV